jgi:hypothetical protein
MGSAEHHNCRPQLSTQDCLLENAFMSKQLITATHKRKSFFFLKDFSNQSISNFRFRNCIFNYFRQIMNVKGFP